MHLRHLRFCNYNFMLIKIKILFFLFLPFLLVVLISDVQSAKAQSPLSMQNLANVDVNSLSDDQITKLLQQAQSSGMTEAELEDQALQRGMPPDQIALLKQRISQLSSANLNKSATTSSSRNQSTKRNYNGENQIPGLRSSQLNNSSKTDTLKKVLSFNDVFEGIRVKVFGEDLFNNPNLTFEPNLRIPTPKNYQLGADDQILIDIYGYSETSYKLTINPDGYVRIPNIGPVYLNGLSIEQSRQKISGELSKVYSGMKGSHPVTFVQISLGDIRSIKVIIIGEVKLPGTYTLPSLATTFNALYSSGGPDKNGSFRNILLIRGGKVISKIDVYDFLIYGNSNENLHLEDQDVIKINPYISRVEFKGEVKRPGMFEIKQGETLEKILSYAGGFTDRAYTHRIKVIRTDGTEKTIADISEDNYSSFLPERGDQFEIGKISNRFANRVQIKGAVFRPGFYALEDGMTLKQLIQKADGVKEDAFIGRAIIRRLKSDNTPEIISFNINNVLGKQQADIPLKREDSVYVYSRFQLQEKYTVSLEGEVMKPDTLPWAANMRLEDLIIMSGGLTDAASHKRINVVRRIKDSNPLSKLSPIAKTFTFDISKDLTGNTDAANFILEPFDNVFVRALPGYEVQRYVFVAGEVLYPGLYGISFKNEHLSDAIKAAGGLTAEAFPEGATVIRKNLVDKFDRDQQRDQIRKILNNSPDSTQLSKLISLQTKNSSDPVGINLQKILQNPGSKYDLVILDGDSIKIPLKLETVLVKGQVLYPVKVRYDKSSTLKDYINSAGGFSKRALMNKTYVVYANGSVKSTSKFLFFNNYPPVKAGSQIFVPDKGEKRPVSAGELIGVTSGLASIAVLIYSVLKK